MRPREFWARDLVLRRAIGGARDISAEKLTLNWEGPYRVTVITRVGAYYLEDMEERPLPRPWNVQNLKKKILPLCKILKNTELNHLLICNIVYLYIVFDPCYLKIMQQKFSKDRNLA